MDASIKIWKEKLEKLIEDTRHNFRLARLQDIRDYDNVLNTQMQAGILMMDIIIPLDRIEQIQSKLEKLFYVRMMVVVIRDYFDDISTIIGKDLKEELVRNGFDNFIPKLNEINKRYSILRKEHLDELTYIRNNASAHKNKDSMSYLYLLDTIRIDNYIELAEQMWHNTKDLFMTCVKLSDLIVEKLESKRNVP